MTELNIFIENLYDKFDFDYLETQNNVEKMTKFLLNDKTVFQNSCLIKYKYKVICFDIVFVNNEEIHRINKEYRKKDSPTDVITFAIFADSPDDEKFIIDGEINLGEIIVSIDKIRQQAEENSNEFFDELYYIISHGILHLLGFDHQTEKDYNFMVEKQNKAKALVYDKI